MIYWILPASGIPVSRNTLQHVTYLETCTDDRKQRFEVYYKAKKDIFTEIYTEEAFAGPDITKPKMDMWDELEEDNEDFQSEFNNVFENPAVKELDEEFTPDLYDNYVNMQLTLDRGGDDTKISRADKIPRDAKCRPIGVDNDNPILDLRIYEVEYCDGYVAAISANVVADNLFAQVDQEGNIFVMIDSIIDTITDGTQTLQQYAFVISKSGAKQRKNTTKGW